MLSFAVKLHGLKRAIWNNPAVPMEARRRRRRRPGRTASWVSANKIWAQNKTVSNTIRICTLSEDQRACSQLRPTGPWSLQPWAQPWTCLTLIPPLGLDPRKPQGWIRGIVNFFFSAGGFFFRSLRVQTYSIEGNKQFQCKENSQHRVLHTPRGMRMKKGGEWLVKDGFSQTLEGKQFRKQETI